MKTSYLLYLALCVMLFTASVFGACGDANVDEGEECDLGSGNNGPDTGCDNNCEIENNYDCTADGKTCFYLYTEDAEKLRTTLTSNFFFTSGNASLKGVMDMDALNDDSVDPPTIEVIQQAGSVIPLFEEEPSISASGDIVYKVKPSNIQKAQTFTLKITFNVDTSKRTVVAGEVVWNIEATFCPTQVQQPTGEPDKKFVCYKSQADANIFYLKRVPLRDINEYQPGDIVDLGVLDCNCNYKQLVQSMPPPVTP